MNNTGLYGNIKIDKEEFMGFYWQGRTDIFLSYWENIKIPTLVLFGERDELVNTKKNVKILHKLKNNNIDIMSFPLANHNLKKVFDPRFDSEFDWPRIIEGYKASIEKWLRKEKIIE